MHIVIMILMQSKSLIKKIIKQLRLSALEIINTNGDLNLFEKYKKLSFDLASLIYKNNVNIDVLTLLEFTLLPVENNNMLTLTNPSKNEVESKSPNTEIETIETNVIESKKNSDKLTHDNAGENDEKAKNKEIKLTPDNREENSDNLSLIDIRVNNCFVKASKNYLNSIKESWQTYLDKLTRKKLKGLLLDLDVVLASDQYVVLKSSFENTVKEVNNSLIVIEESFNKITDLDYRFIAISDELWGKKTEEYKQNIRNNVVYTLMSEPDNNGDTGLLNDVFNDIKIEVQ